MQEPSEMQTRLTDTYDHVRNYDQNDSPGFVFNLPPCSARSHDLHEVLLMKGYIGHPRKPFHLD